MTGETVSVIELLRSGRFFTVHEPRFMDVRKPKRMRNHLAEQPVSLKVLWRINEQNCWGDSSKHILYFVCTTHVQPILIQVFHAQKFPQRTPKTVSRPTTVSLRWHPLLAQFPYPLHPCIHSTFHSGKLGSSLSSWRRPRSLKLPPHDFCHVSSTALQNLHMLKQHCWYLPVCWEPFL